MPIDDTLNDGVEAHEPLEEDAVELNDIVSHRSERGDANTAGVLRSDETDGDLGGTGGKWSVDVGVDVVGCCGHKIGEVVDVRDDYVIVEKGFFMPEDVFVPKTAISGADEHHLTLNVSKNSVDHSDWDEDPEDRIIEQRRRAS